MATPTIVKARLNHVTLATGIAIVVLGILMFTAGFRSAAEANKMKGNTNSEFQFSNHSQYWAGIPVIITAILVIVTSFVKNQHASLRIGTAISLLISIIVSLAVIIEENTIATSIQIIRKSCVTLASIHVCENIIAADAWFQTLLICSDIVLVLCLVTLLVNFASWILSMQQENGNEDAAVAGQGRYQPLSTYEYDVHSAGVGGQLGQTSQPMGQPMGKGSQQHYVGQRDVTMVNI